jgi:hypothetical protein
MAKEWILNSVMNRFQLNYKRNVGATSESIRKCRPKTVEEWRDYYFANVHPLAHIEELGQKLYIKISEVVQAEVEEISEQDCVDYMVQLIIDRTFDGYITEIRTVYGKLQELLGVPIEPAPDEWDRSFNVDFFIKIAAKYIGIQIKQENQSIQLPEIFKEKAIQLRTHALFTQKFGGKVFYVYSVKNGEKREIKNMTVIEELRKEIARLGGVEKL